MEAEDDDDDEVVSVPGHTASSRKSKDGSKGRSKPNADFSFDFDGVQSQRVSSKDPTKKEWKTPTELGAIITTLRDEWRKERKDCEELKRAWEAEKKERKRLHEANKKLKKENETLALENKRATDAVNKAEAKRKAADAEIVRLKTEKTTEIGDLKRKHVDALATLRRHRQQRLETANAQYKEKLENAKRDMMRRGYGDGGGGDGGKRGDGGGGGGGGGGSSSFKEELKEELKEAKKTIKTLEHDLRALKKKCEKERRYYENIAHEDVDTCADQDLRVALVRMQEKVKQMDDWHRIADERQASIDELKETICAMENKMQRMRDESKGQGLSEENFKRQREDMMDDFREMRNKLIEEIDAARKENIKLITMLDLAKSNGFVDPNRMDIVSGGGGGGGIGGTGALNQSLLNVITGLRKELNDLVGGIRGQGSSIRSLADVMGRKFDTQNKNLGIMQTGIHTLVRSIRKDQQHDFQHLAAYLGKVSASGAGGALVVGGGFYGGGGADRSLSGFSFAHEKVVVDPAAYEEFKDFSLRGLPSKKDDSMILRTLLVRKLVQTSNRSTTALARS